MLAAQSPRRTGSTSIPTTGPMPSCPGVMKSRAVPSGPMATIFRLYRLLRYRVRVFASHAVPSAVRSRSGSSKAVVLVEIGRREASMLAATSLHAATSRRRSKAESAGASSHDDRPFGREPREEGESGVGAAGESVGARVVVRHRRHPRRDGEACSVPSRYPAVSPRANASSPPCTRAPICS